MKRILSRFLPSDRDGLWPGLLLLGAWLVCVYVGFIVLRHFTSMPAWACVVLALPAGVAMFVFCAWSVDD